MNNTIVTFFSDTFGFQTTPLITFIIFFLAIFIVVQVMALIGGLGTYAERKISADMQLRQGPNRVGPYGILQFLADGVKMICKEDLIPRNADRFSFILAPLLALGGVFATLAVLPFSKGLTLTDLNVGVIYLLGVSSLVGVAVFLGGYASNSKWSMLGGMRGASQIISYEVPISLAIMSVITLTGSLSFVDIVDSQGGMPWNWNLFHNPFMFINFFIYFVAALAEANRAPFDLPEAESELVSGYHTEYSGMRFGMFALAEYIEVFVLCGIAAAMFLGGYNVPGYLGNGSWFMNVLHLPKFIALPLGQLLQLGAFFTKTLGLYYVVIWVRWTLPRLRVDQLMVVCWKYLTPIALFNLVGTAVWVYCFKGASIINLIAKIGSAASGSGH